MTCGKRLFSVSQGSVATHANCDGTHDNHSTANVLENLPVQLFGKSLKFDRIVVNEFGVQLF